jgi:hypothetical protein
MGWVKGEAEHLMQDRKIGEMSGIPSAARARGVIAATIRGRILTGCCRIAPLPSPGNGRFVPDRNSRSPAIGWDVAYQG